MPHKQWESEHGLYRKLPEVLFAKTELNIIYGLRKNETKQKKQNKKAVFAIINPNQPAKLSVLSP